MTFDKKLKKLLVNDENAQFIYINNFEVEEVWAEDDVFKLPTFTLGKSNRVVNRMEELGLFLATDEDFLILKEDVDFDYISFLIENNLTLPKRIILEKNYPELNVTENILQCEDTLCALRSLQGENIYLMPFGPSNLEERLSELVGIPLATPTASICKKVNSKIYSRNLNNTFRIEQIPGYNCESIEELEKGFQLLKQFLIQGEKLVIKDANGVSGKGIVVIDSEKKFFNYCNFVKKSFKKNSNQKFQMVIEKWITKTCDLNYQFIIGKNGEIEFNFVKESIVENGVHQGHVIPSRLNETQVNELINAANIIGKALYTDGYFGVVGVDAILSTDGTLYPNLEINARFNMSTYQSLIQEKFIGDNKFALANKKNFLLDSYLSFKELKILLSDLLFKDNEGIGILITNFATVNAAFQSNGTSFEGRLYYVIVEKDMESVWILEEEIKKRISLLERKAREKSVQ